MRGTRHLPSWLLGLLPVRLARQYARPSSPIEPQLGVRQLLVDVSVIYQSDARTGIQRVVRSLLLQLLAAPPVGYRVCPVFATRRQGYHHAGPGFLGRSDAALEVAGEPVETQCGDIFLGLDLAAHLLPRHRAQVLRWKRGGVKVHVMVYDLLPVQHPEWFNPKTTRNFERWIKWLAVYADSAICISTAVKTDLSQWLQTEFALASGALPATSIALGGEIAASAPSAGVPPIAEGLLARMRTTPTVLMVGTLEPRKGHDQAVAAMDHIWQQGTDPSPLFVVVGKPGWKTEALQADLRTHPQAGKQIFWLEDASDELLQRLYDACRGVLIASRAEGFGLPLIEAALHSKPVLARDLRVFREIDLPHVNYFEGDDPETLAARVVAWLKSVDTKEVCPTLSSRYSWTIAAAQLTVAMALSRPAEQANRTDFGNKRAANQEAFA